LIASSTARRSCTIGLPVAATSSAITARASPSSTAHSASVRSEVNQPGRRVRRQRGKPDPINAENAARAVLAGTASATPKSAEDTVEMIRHTKIAWDTTALAKRALHTRARRWLGLDQGDPRARHAAGAADRSAGLLNSSTPSARAPTPPPR